MFYAPVFTIKSQTLKQLSAKYGQSIPWIMKQRDEYVVDFKVHNPRPVNLICDATFYGKRKDKLGTLVFKDNESKEILIWKHIESETIKDYKYLKEELKKEIKIEAFTLKTNFLDTEIIIDKNSKIILNGNFNLLEKVFDFDYIVDSKNLQTPYIIITQPLHVEGKFVGNLKEFQLNGRGKAFRSNIRFFVDMEDKNIKNIKLNAKNVKMEDVLSILKKPIYTKGMFDINIDVKQTQKDTITRSRKNEKYYKKLIF